MATTTTSASPPAQVQSAHSSAPREVSIAKTKKTSGAVTAATMSEARCR